MVYEYDFGSTTELFVCINSVREGEKGSNEICEEAFWCEECLREEHDIDDDYEDDGDYVFESLLPVCNSKIP